MQTLYILGSFEGCKYLQWVHLLQMPAEERGAKQLGRAQAASHLAQLGLTLALGILVMAEPWPTASSWRAVYGGFGILYALQVSARSLTV